MLFKDRLLHVKPYPPRFLHRGGIKRASIGLPFEQITAKADRYGRERCCKGTCREKEQCGHSIHKTSFPDPVAIQVKVPVPGPINVYHQNDEQDCRDDDPHTKGKFFPGEMPVFPTGKGPYGAKYHYISNRNPKEFPIKAPSGLPPEQRMEKKRHKGREHHPSGELQNLFTLWTHTITTRKKQTSARLHPALGCRTIISRWDLSKWGIIEDESRYKTKTAAKKAADSPIIYFSRTAFPLMCSMVNASISALGPLRRMSDSVS